ncbi:MAG: molybdopterin-guanine dinucleotide biosynthesis protein B, partial [Pseudomonadota bacterium]
MSDKTLVTPILGVCAYGSGMGKTTLLLKLIPELISRGLRISVVKHAHHRFDIDHPGKDSYRLREAGAAQMMIGSSRRWALMTELAEIPATAQVEPELADLLAQMDTKLADLILVEGFRHAP